jgi:uncharacterized membrane protein (UPF0127 family)
MKDKEAVRVQNITKKRLITPDCRQVNPYYGLMFQRPRPVFFRFRTPRIVALHMCFVIGASDVLFVRAGRVVEVARRFSPWTFYTPKERADTIIELPAGMARGVSVGDKLSLR